MHSKPPRASECEGPSSHAGPGLRRSGSSKAIFEKSEADVCVGGVPPYRDMVFISSPMALLLPDLRSLGLAWDEGPSHSLERGGWLCHGGDGEGREANRAKGDPFPPG